MGNPTIAYKKISDYIQHVMQPQANFQRVMLNRLIVEQLNSPPGKIMLCSKKRIDSDILNENPEKPKDFVSTDVYSTLVDKHKIVSSHLPGTAGVGYSLDVTTGINQGELRTLLDLLRECFVLVGPEENWQIGLKGSHSATSIMNGVWGISDKEPSNVTHWTNMKSGDYAVFYRTKKNAEEEYYISPEATAKPFISSTMVSKMIEHGNRIAQKNWTRKEIINARFRMKEWRSDGEYPLGTLWDNPSSSEEQKAAMIKVIQEDVDRAKQLPSNENGIFGIGRVTEKFLIKNPVDKNHIIFADEKREGRIKYPLRFRFEIIHRDNGALDRNVVPGIPTVKGVNRIANRTTKDKLLEELSKTWRIKLTNTPPKPSNEPQKTPNYLMLKSISGPANEYYDEVGREYNYPQNIPNAKQIQPGTKSIWYEIVHGKIYVWGFGTITECGLSQFPQTLRAVTKDFHVFNESGMASPLGDNHPPEYAQWPLPADIQNEIEGNGSWNIQNSIIRIDQNLYEKMTNSEQGWPVDKAIVGLELPSTDKISKFKGKIAEELLIEPSVIDRMISSLYAGKHILLTGPVGTGKTDLARRLPSIVWNYCADIHTANAEWTTQDVIGGPYPKSVDGRMEFPIRNGCVTSTISKNWSDRTGQNGGRIGSTQKDYDNITKEMRGVWLVIDEFNRANIDRAFGELFTALEYKELKVPSGDKNKEHKTYIIPDDYRIIGTLNSFDKHFLFQMSDALKRRFDFIEILPPTRKKIKEEKDIAIKKARNQIPEGAAYDSQVSDLNTVFETLQEILAFIRISKPLGTAILISMFQDMLVYSKMGKEPNECLDAALVKKIIPQLESLPASAIRAIRLFVDNNFAQHYVKFDWDARREQSQDYAHELENLRIYFREKSRAEWTSNWTTEFLQERLTEANIQQQRRMGNLEQDLRIWETPPSIPDFSEAMKKLMEEKEFSGIESIGTE